MQSTSSHSISEHTYQALLNSIVQRQIAPGEVLEERRLSEELSVSRTPLRAALNRLLGEGIVARLSNGSVIVKAFGATELLELLHIRILLEGEAACLAAGRIASHRLQHVRDQLQAIMEQAEITEEQDWAVDNEVHELVAQHCGNKAMAKLIADARLRVRLCNVESAPGRSVRARQEHMAIIEALQTGDGAKSRVAMATHLTNVRQTYMSILGYITQ